MEGQTKLMEGREIPEPIVMPGAISRAIKASIPQSQREWGGRAPVIWAAELCEIGAGAELRARNRACPRMNCLGSKSIAYSGSGASLPQRIRWVEDGSTSG